MTRPMTIEERKLLQALIDNAYDQFLDAVVQGRKRPESVIRPLADGRIFTGEQALKAGLIDSLGDQFEAIKAAAKMGGIQDAKPRVVRDSESISSIMDLFESRLAWMMSSPELRILESVRDRTYTGLEYRWGK